MENAEKKSLRESTRYGMEGTGIESRWWRYFPYRSWGTPSLLNDGYRVFSGGKAAGPWRRTPTPSSADVKERVELYFYSPSVYSRPVLG